MAPVMMQEEEGEGDTPDELDDILKEALLNNILNLDIIKKDFNTASSAKVCGEMTYSIIFEDNCTILYDGIFNYNILWATADPTTLSGRVLYEFALFNWIVPWFEWEGACDLKTSLLLNLTSLPNFCYNDSEIRASLSHLTQQVS